jgi:hypothetical protein
MYTKECEENNNMWILISVRNPDEKSVPQTSRRQDKIHQAHTDTFNLLKNLIINSLNNLIIPYNLKRSKVVVREKKYSK